MSSWAFQPLSTSAAILSTPSAIFKYWDGSEWISGTLNIYDGNEFVAVGQLKIWDGNEWTIIRLRSHK